jgi:sec-independent protein translocase protein TatC
VTDDASPQGEMSLMDHLGEFRNRLFRSALALVVGAAIGYILFPDLLDFLLDPYCASGSAYNPGGIEGQCALVAQRPLDPFSVRMKTSLVFGLFVGGPVIFFQIWSFIAPGLTKRERRLAAPFVFGSQVMFASGLAFSYFIIPKGLTVLLNFAGDRVTPLLSATEYLSFLLTTGVAFGVVFEIPLVLVFLSLLGMIRAEQMATARPYAVVVNAIVAAIVTPTTDPVTMLFMLLPMVLFYEIAIIAARIIERARRRRQDA